MKGRKLARLPNPGGDDGSWGVILNDYLGVSHEDDGTIKQSAIVNAGGYVLPSGGIPKATLASSVQTSLTKADSALQSAPVSSVAGKTGAVTLAKADVGLSNVDNTSDADKPISTATQTALNTKASASSLAPVATSGSYNDLTDKPVISGAIDSTDDLAEGSTNLYYTDARATAAAPVASVAGKTGAVTLAKADVGLANVDNTSDTDKPISTATQTALDSKADTSALGDYATTDSVTTGLAAKADTTSLATVATSGSYTDLTNTPTLPTITVSSTQPSSPNIGDLWVDLGS